MSSIRHLAFKAVIVGDDQVGKTTLCKNLFWKAFQHEYKQTIGADFYVYSWHVNLEEFKTQLHVKWLLFDLAGQYSQFQVVRPLLYRGAHAAIVIFDISRPETFKSVPLWIYEFWRNVSQSAIEKRPFIIVGNKADLREKATNCLPREQAEDYIKQVAKNLDFKPTYIEISALYGWGVEELFKRLLLTILEYYEYSDILLRTSSEKR